MRLYQITGLAIWAGTQADAKRLAREHGAGYIERDVPTDKAGLLAFLNAEPAGIPRQAGSVPNSIEVRHIEPAAPVPTSTAPMAEDAFEALPLPMQLHLAALALENARAKIKP